MKKENIYDERYAEETYYWGKQPSAMCERVVETMQPSAGFRPKLLDLGCGEGRDAVYFAKCGFDVAGVDLSPAGLEKTQRYAKEVGVQVETIQADIIAYQLRETYDVIFSTGTLHYIPPEARAACFQDYKDHTSPDGINALALFVKKPFIPPAPDTEATSYPYKSGELLGYYWDWEILYCEEEIFDCASGGIAHKHAISRIIAKRHSNPG